jgi:hypothetical protein
MIEETWKPIKNYEGLYEVSSEGRVKSLAKKRLGGRYKCLMLYKERILKPGKNAQGYLKLDLCKNGKTKTHRINRLVAAAFMGESFLECNHIDGNKENNCVSNLEYCTCSENHKHAYKTGLMDRRGERHHLAKLNNETVKNIRGNKFRLTVQEFSLLYEISISAVWNVIKRKSWVHVL